MSDKTTEQRQNSHRSDAHKIGLELMKQIITLSSGVLALSATFISEFYIDCIYLQILLLSSWVLLAVSVFFGIETISAIVKSRIDNISDWSIGIGKRNASISKTSFLIGLILFAVFAFISLLNSP